MSYRRNKQWAESGDADGGMTEDEEDRLTAASYSDWYTVRMEVGAKRGRG